MPDIKITPLGAGQDVGRSCILLSMGGKNIMLDCGMHMGYNDERRFPDFSYIVPEGPITSHIDCVIISHFHLDHCGALPYMSEIVGYTGPIYMTHPTKAIAPILLEDMRKVAVERKGESNFFTTQMIKDCMKKVIAVTLHQSVMVDSELEIKAYYAGHVLGAAMFWIRVGSQSVVYTGDYNMTPDRHLGAAWIDKCRPDLLISESTYATTIRDSKRCRERDFLKKVHECVARGGKVLIPVFALGRAQELCILLETYWERMNLKYPIYFAVGLTEKANNYYKMFITWTNQKIRKTFVHRNMFDFKHIKPFDKGYIDNPGAMVVFATPGMLHAGLSLQIFKKWAPHENNMVIMPGYCVQGTVGHKILGGAKKVEFENRQVVDVKMSVEYMSFSAHADAKGIMQLIQYCEPKNVLLVHGEALKMEFLKEKIKEEFSIECYTPANGETCVINTPVKIPVDASLNLLKAEAKKYNAQPPDPKRRRIIHGVLVMKDNKISLMNVEEVCKEAGIHRHVMKFTSTVKLEDTDPAVKTTEKLYNLLQDKLTDWNVVLQDSGTISVESVDLTIEDLNDKHKKVFVSWTNQDEDLGSYILGLLQNMGNEEFMSQLMLLAQKSKDRSSFTVTFKRYDGNDRPQPREGRPRLPEPEEYMCLIRAKSKTHKLSTVVKRSDVPRDVGRSCILLSMGGKNIMLDCGMHMGYNDERRFPDFSYIVPEGPITSHIDCVIISHFHLDHCGALPYMSEIVGYTGPIYMTHPTKAIAPILLEDMRKVAVERKGESNFFTTQMIKDCMKKVIAVTLHQSVMVDSELEIKAYYAGHVLGAAMFWIRVGSQSVVYTGDYNMTPDRHLGAAWIDKCRPDLLISESTYATTIRDSKRCRERDFLKKVHECVARGGKVLIPVFALGRAQELCILLETYWERMNLKYPIYFAVGLTEKANNYYKMFITWTNQKIRKTFVHRNMFDFKHIKPFDKGYIDNPGAMVVFATPGMLHAGLSLQIFKKWAPHENNMVIMPGYCVQGTVGHKILGGAKKVEFENRQVVDVKMSVEYMSFSAHADAKGIMQLIQYCEPKNVLLVHGEALKMEFLKEKIKEEFSIECYTPANGETCVINTPVKIPVDASLNLLKAEAKKYNAQPPDPKRRRIIHGVLVMKDNKISLMNVEEVCKEAGIHRHVMKFTSTVKLEDTDPAMVLLSNEEFMSQLMLLAQKSKDRSSFTVTFKRYDGNDRPQPREGRPRLPEPEEYMCLIRAKSKTHKPSTVVKRSDVPRRKRLQIEARSLKRKEKFTLGYQEEEEESGNEEENDYYDKVLSMLNVSSKVSKAIETSSEEDDSDDEKETQSDNPDNDDKATDEDTTDADEEVPPKRNKLTDSTEESESEADDEEENLPDANKVDSEIRPKILIILPFKSAAYNVINMLIELLVPELAGKVINHKRYVEEFTGGELEFPQKNPKPEDYEKIFSGNSDDNFRIGISVTKKCLKLYSEFYSADFIVASPLGLRMIIGAAGDEKRDYDFLASIEMLIIDQMDVILSQNWLHLLHIFDHLHLNLQTRKNTDFARVRSWCVNGWSRFYRQTLLFSNHDLPEFVSLLSRQCRNYRGSVRVANPITVGSVQNVSVQIHQVFHRIEVKSLETANDTRFEYFVRTILPRFKAPFMAHCLIFVPNYFDFVRIRNYCKKESISFVQVCEYTEDAKIARARDMFYHSGAHFMLYTERAHFYRRTRIKGIRHIVMYQPPSWPHFYPELLNLMQTSYQNPRDGLEAHTSITVLYTKYDALQTAAILGTEQTAGMLRSSKLTHTVVKEK
uniref:Integrator complex subunit 11 n=2 Tax=Lutzomyia longipalpis TaxID=7200 RepID=A0A1B0CS58_LUTLO